MNLSKSKEAKLIRYCKRCDLKAVQDLINPKNRLFSNSINGFDFNRKLHQNTINTVSHVDVNYREPKFQMTPLMVASIRGSRDIVLYLIKHGANISLRDVKGNTALQLACMKQRFHVIDALLQNKANPNDVNMSGWNCLFSAVNYFHEDSAIMLLLLLQTGCKSDHKDNSGLTCIDHAVRKNKINAIRIILNFNLKLATSCTRALINASIKGYFDIVLLLLNFGVNPNKIDIITGTGPLHEAVRYNDIKDEKSRLERLKIVHYLTLFGADPETPNLKRETPIKLALIKPQSIAEQYIEAMKGFYTSEPKMPKFININATSLKDLFQVPNYPLLKPQLNWTRNDHRFCSSYNQNTKTDLVTNLIDGDPNSIWTAPGQNLNWVIFDFKADHCISKIRLYAWKSKEMPSECYLQVSNSLEGPWNSVQTFKCEMIGSSLRTSPGIPIDFNGFHAVARFWRLVIAKNHGASQTSIHGVEFFGYDYRITKLIEQLKLTEYEDILIENDLNQIEALVSCTYEHFEKIPIEMKSDKDKLWNFILEFQRKVKPLKKLEWFNEPLPIGLVGQPLAAFSVTSTAFLTDSLQLISHGGGLINGETCIDMEPGGMNDPSMAIFRNISFSNAGKFILEIKSLNDPEVSISSQPIQIFEIGDPEYDRLIKIHPINHLNNSLHINNVNYQNSFYNNDQTKQNQNEVIDSDDDTLDQIYSFADFSEQSSKMKITKWLPPEQESFENENNNNHRNNFIYMVDGQSKNTINGTSPKSSRSKFKSYENNSNYNSIEFNDNYSPFNSRKSSPKRTVKINEMNSSPPLPPQLQNQYVLPEYEIQTFTVDLLDDNISTYSDNVILNQSFKRQNDKLEPKTEARVYVNNPELILENYNNNSVSPPRSPTASISRFNSYSPSGNKSKVRVDSSPYSKLVSLSQYSSNNNTPNLNSKFSKNSNVSINNNLRESINVNNNTKNEHFYEIEHSSTIIHKEIQNSPTSVNKVNSVYQKTQSNNQSSAPVTTLPPPPPPPLPAFFNNSNQSNKKSNDLGHKNQSFLNLTSGNSSISSGMLKFQKTKSVVKSSNTPPPAPPPPSSIFSSSSSKPNGGLNDELNSKLSKIRKKVEQHVNSSKKNHSNHNHITNQNNNDHEIQTNHSHDQNIIHKFDPNNIDYSIKRKDYHSLKANGENGIYKFDPSTTSNRNEKENKSDINSYKNFSDYMINPNETFTQKAKKALENYKNTRGSNSSNSDIHENNLFKSKKFSKSKHAPLPFKNERNDEPKFIQ